MAGSSSYPTSVDNKTALADGVDYIEADDVNNAYVPETASQTFIGASGASQSNNTDILTFIQKARQSFRLAYTDADTITVSKGEIMCLNSSGTIRVMRKNTSTTAVTFANIDTGARATSTTYYIWAVADATATTVTFKISLSASAPTGVTNYALVGKFATNATGAGQIIEMSVSSYVGDQLVNVGYFETGATATGTTTTPQDDTIPQNTEGTEVMTLVHAAQDALNLLEITVLVNVAASGSTVITAALHQDSVANALAATGHFTHTSGGTVCLPINHMMLAGTVSAATFKVRVGGSGGETITFNGAAGARLYGGVLNSLILIKEYRRVYV